jgi:halocyanin-like protein
MRTTVGGGRTRIGRRAYLAAAGSVAVAALAGCTGDGDGDGGDGDGGGTPRTVEAPAAVAEFLSNTSNFEGGMVDLTGRGEVAVEVGAKGNGNFWAFEPAAVNVSTGTTVVWEWSGQGGAHNVVARDGAYGSELHNDAGVTFEYTFEGSGVSLYVCEPHESSGMKGAVVVG